MKFYILTICFSAMMVFESLAAVTINWSNNANIKDTAGADLAISTSYLFMCVETASSGASTAIGFDASTQTIGAGETLLGSFNWSSSGGIVWASGNFSAVLSGSSVGNVLTGDHIYSVAINSGTQGLATKYSILDTGGTSTPVTLDGASNFDYIVPGNNSWQTTVAVPEPSTIGLLLVGAGLVAFRRMRRG